MNANFERRYTLEEYFELEKTSEERFEFWEGEAFCLPGASQAHSEISGNCIVGLSQRLDRLSSRVFTCRMHLKLPTGPPYLYSDLFRQDDGTWIHTEANELETTLTLGSLGCELPLHEIYAGVSFDAPAGA